MLSKSNKIFNKLLSSKRKSHIINILESFDKEHLELGRNIPLDLHVRKYYLNNRDLSTIDRDFIVDQVYSLIKYKGLLDFLSKPHLNWHTRMDAMYDSDFEKQQYNENLPA